MDNLCGADDCQNKSSPSHQEGLLCDSVQSPVR